MNAYVGRGESLASKLLRYIKENKEFTLQELYSEFGDSYERHSIRARLYESEPYRERKVIKTKNGSYALVGAEVEAIVECVDTREHIYRLSEAKMTYDLIIIDSPYQTAAQRGGNRQLTNFDFITPKEFGNIIVEVEKLLKNEYSQVLFMISGGESGKRDVDRYLRMFDKTSLKLSSRGAYTKYNRNGSVCNMGKYAMPPEQMLSFSLSGKERMDTDTTASTDYHFERPPLPHHGGYSTQKPLGLMKAIISRATLAGEKILDIFAGSGVSFSAALALGRKIHGFEINPKAIEEHILPRLKLFDLDGLDESNIYRVPAGAMVQTSMLDFM